MLKKSIERETLYALEMKIFNLSVLFFKGAAVGGGEAIIGAENKREVENRLFYAVYKRS